MDYDVRTERAQPRRLAAIRARIPRDRLGPEIIRLLDKIWPVLRAQQASTGHNVVIYHAATDGATHGATHGATDGATHGLLTVDVGVEVPAGFAPVAAGEVQPAATPEGEVATTAHFGDYAKLADAYAALEQWCASQDRQPAGVNWEVYGDWDDDPAQVRTDVYFLLNP